MATTEKPADTLIDVKNHDMEGVRKDVGVETQQAIDDMLRIPAHQMPDRCEQVCLIGNTTERMAMGYEDDEKPERQADRKRLLERWRARGHDGLGGGSQEGRRRGRSGPGCASLGDHEDKMSPHLQDSLGLMTGSPDSNGPDCRDAVERNACVRVHHGIDRSVRRIFPTDEYVTAIHQILGKARTNSPSVGAQGAGRRKLGAVEEVVKFIEDKTRFAESPHRFKVS